MEKDKKYTIYLTKEELYILAHLTRHFADYMCGDDRPDHGMGILKQYREDNFKGKWFDEKPKHIQSFFSVMGKLNRKDRKLRKL